MMLGVIGGLGVTVTGLAVWRIVEAAAEGRLDRNSEMGIRTVRTRRSDEAWVTGHQKARPLARIIFGYCVLMGLALTGSGVRDGEAASFVTGVLFAMAYMGATGGLLGMAFLANKGARSSD
ncbi:SdpI family protein [Austwickia chelonae]|uniref:SdpI family protein n=1 Tax=Austwickia chelonae TaxID=100225 RepID=UPI000E25EF89